MATPRDNPSGRAQPPVTDWELYRRLRAEGRLNLLFRQRRELAAWLPADSPSEPPSNIYPFVSRAEHLAWRRVWTNGRWVKSSWTPEQRLAIRRQDAIYREADKRWAESHGPVVGGALVARISAAGKR
jgi:hypothetical protein